MSPRRNLKVLLLPQKYYFLCGNWNVIFNHAASCGRETLVDFNYTNNLFKTVAVRPFFKRKKKIVGAIFFFIFISFQAFIFHEKIF
jgi:hypothetical protein